MFATINTSAAANQEIATFGCKVVAQYAVLGAFDFVTIIQAPDNETIAHLSVDLGSRGTAKIQTLPAIAIEWYKVLVPLPYVVLMAVIHARRTAGPKWFEAALLAALLWPSTTVLAEYLYGRHTFEQEPAEFFDRFAFWWGAPYPLLVVVLFAAPIISGLFVKRREPG